MEWSSDQQQQLLSLIKRRHERDRLLARLHEANRWAETCANQQTERAGHLAREQADVERLTGLSWASLYYSVLNQKKERLTREEAEVAHAELAFANAVEQLNQAKHTVDALTRQLADYAPVDDDYAELLAQKRSVVHLRWDETGRAYDRLTKAVEDADQRLVETKEVGRAAIAVLNELEKTDMLLREARQLGYSDMVGGALVSLMKVNKLDQVRRQTHELTRTLRLFSAEYEDIGRVLQHSVDLDGWNRIGEVLFDNIFTDVATQSRIDRAIHTVERLGEIVVPIVDELTEQVDLLTTDLTRESDALRSFLERA